MDLSEIEYFLASVECKHCSGMGNFPHMMDWQSVLTVMAVAMLCSVSRQRKWPLSLCHS